MSLRARTGLAVAMLVWTTAACSSQGSSDDRADAGSRTGTARSGDVLVSAAASLTDAFTEVEAAFEAAHPELDVVLNLGGSSLLRAQILEGAPVDVFASANAENMDRAAEAAQLSGEPYVFARNALQIAVPAGNPSGVHGLGDFADDARLIGLCADQVPCGAMARRVLERAGVVAALDTNEPDVRVLLTKIELGELDAGITYVTDVASTRGAVEGIDIPEDMNVTAEYLIAVVAGAPNPQMAESFVRFVLSAEGRTILARFGFAPP